MSNQIFNIMHKPIVSLLTAVVAALSLLSCSKEQTPQPPVVTGDGSAVTLTFVADDIASQTRAFFSPTASTEV